IRRGYLFQRRKQRQILIRNIKKKVRSRIDTDSKKEKFFEIFSASYQWRITLGYTRRRGVLALMPNEFTKVEIMKIVSLKN
ncbi:MAG TPA: hypothetical protein PLT78_15565, partial [Ignavibacteriaceae bacterium]|nr:hypothetical protein [Ignavibacteriaceae bacterium]